MVVLKGSNMVYCFFQSFMKRELCYSSTAIGAHSLYPTSYPINYLLLLYLLRVKQLLSLRRESLVAKQYLKDNY